MIKKWLKKKMTQKEVDVERKRKAEEREAARATFLAVSGKASNVRELSELMLERISNKQKERTNDAT